MENKYQKKLQFINQITDSDVHYVRKSFAHPARFHLIISVSLVNHLKKILLKLSAEIVKM